ncbi:MAG: PilS N terminal [Glomeribacter sp. 1016415]|nr:type 4 pilus major pilin [Mycoavidus cysteinexigens]MCX8566921.1 PilS N terminal [Glomeribacter sp. 1016415]
MKTPPPSLLPSSRLKYTTPNRQKTQNSHQRGSLMAEYGLVLLLVSFGLVSTLVYFSTNSQVTHANTLAMDLNSLIGSVRTAYSGNYQAINNTALHQGGFFRSLPSLKDNHGAVTISPGNGVLTVTPSQINATGDAVQYQITNLPDITCLPLVTALARSASRLTINTSEVKAPGGQPDPSQIRCIGDANTLTLVVG